MPRSQQEQNGETNNNSRQFSGVEESKNDHVRIPEHSTERESLRLAESSATSSSNECVVEKKKIDERCDKHSNFREEEVH